MLLFKPYHIPLVINGSKPDSRRMWDVQRVNVGSFQQIKTRIFTKEHFGYIEILGIRKEPLNDITEEGARREGGYTREEYIKLFHEIYPHAGENPSPFVLTFRYVGMQKPTLPDSGKARTNTPSQESGTKDTTKQGRT